MWRIYSWMEKLIDRHDRKSGWKTRGEMLGELVDTSLELEHLKLDLEPIPKIVIEYLRDIFNEEFHKSAAKRPNLSVPEQERHLQQYIDLALKLGMSAEEFLNLDHVEFRELMIGWVIGNELTITEIQSGIAPQERTTLLYLVSDAAEQVGL